MIKKRKLFTYDGFGEYIATLEFNQENPFKYSNQSSKTRIKQSIFRRGHLRKYIEYKKEESRKLFSVKVPNMIHKLIPQSTSYTSTVRMRRYERLPEVLPKEN